MDLDYKRLVELTEFDFKQRQEILRTPQLLPYWKDLLSQMLEEANQNVGALSFEIRGLRGLPDVVKELNTRLERLIHHRARIRAKFYEATNLLSASNPEPTNTQTENEPNSEVLFLSKKLKEANNKVSQLSNELTQVRDAHKACSKDPAKLSSKLDAQILHGLRTTAEKNLSQSTLRNILALLDLDGLDKEVIRQLIIRACDRSTIDKYVKDYMQKQNENDVKNSKKLKTAKLD